MTPGIVIDTNVYLSALVFGGNPRTLLELVTAGSVDAVTSEHIYVEMRRVIAQKFPQFSTEYRGFEVLLRECTIVVPLGSVAVQACRDPDDNAVIETALVGLCETIVTGDTDLLALGEYDEVSILTPREFLLQLRESI